MTPNDPAYVQGLLWGLNNAGQDGGVPNADIDAPEGWDVQNMAPNVIVAVIERVHEFAAHALRVIAAYVIAFEKNLAAPADAHQAMSEIFEASRFIASAKQGEDRDQDEGKLQDPIAY